MQGTKILLMFPNLILTIIHPESAIVLARLTGETWWVVLLRIEILSNFVMLGFYEVLRGIFWLFNKIFRINLSFRSKANYENKYLKNTKTNMSLWVQSTIENLKVHPYILLFILNLIPAIPYLTTATIIAVSALKIQRGMIAVLAGNAVKILVVVLIVFAL